MGYLRTYILVRYYDQVYNITGLFFEINNNNSEDYYDEKIKEI